MYQLTKYPCIHTMIYLLYHGVNITPTMINLVDPYYRSSCVLKSSEKSLPNLPEVSREEFNHFDDMIRASLTIPRQVASAITTYHPNCVSSKRSYDTSFYSKALSSVPSLKEQVNKSLAVQTYEIVTPVLIDNSIISVILFVVTYDKDKFYCQ